jgi:polar amino acid transport system substrate-binding protein
VHIVKHTGFVLAVASILSACSSAQATPGPTQSGSQPATQPSATQASSAASSTSGNPYGLITPGVIKVATFADDKPYEFVENGAWKGFDIELFTEMAKRIDPTLKIEWVGLDFSAIMPGVANGLYDIGVGPIGTREERKKVVDFIHDFSNGYLRVIAAKTSGIKSEADLAGKRIGMIGSTVEEFYAIEHWKSTDIVRFPDNNAAIAALNTGQIDGVFLDGDPAKTAVDQFPKLEIAVQVLSTAPSAYVVRHNTPEWKAALNKALTSIALDGTLANLTIKWLGKEALLPDYTPQGWKP